MMKKKKSRQISKYSHLVCKLMSDYNCDALTATLGSSFQI